MREKKHSIPTQDKLFKRDIPSMPKGYYSGDKPNPNLRDFVETHMEENPFDPEHDNYDVLSFSKALHIANRRSAVNDLHIYWSKKPFDAVQTYIDHYATPGSLVLDPFAGSGGTALCALRRGCSAIAIDLSPASTFITKYYCTPIDLDEFQYTFKQIVETVSPTIKWLYEARSPSGGEAAVAYTVWSQVYQCDRCFSYIPLGACAEVPAFNKDGTPRKARGGGQATALACKYCFRRGFNQIINTGSTRYGRVPIRSSLIYKDGRKNKRLQKYYPFPERASKSKELISLESIAEACESADKKFEIERLIEIKNTAIPFSYPKCRMMNSSPDCEKWGILWRAGVADFSTVDELFEKRALWAISAYFDAARSADCSSNIRDALLGVLSSALWNCTKMYRERKKGGGPQEGVYYLPPLSREVNVENIVAGKKNTLVRANEDIASSIKTTNLIISTQSATDMGSIPSNSIDYIFTDPPYSWKVPFGELNFLWESFLGFRTDWHDNEVIISDVRGIDELEWSKRLKESFHECFRVLKPGRCLTLCYHDSAEGTWELVQDIMAECGFIVEKCDASLSIGTDQKSLKQLTAAKITQRDLIINFRKPKPDESSDYISITGEEDQSSFNDKVRKIIGEYLEAKPGASIDRIYDEVVSKMVRSGMMEVHNFEELLRQVAEEVRQPVMKDLFTPEEPNLFGTHETSRWYLKETEFDKVDLAESAKEDAAAGILSSFMKKYLEKKPDIEGVHYSDLFEHYVYTVKDKARRLLADWLPDYFFKTDTGTWRLPISEEEEKLKAEGRKKGINRLIKHYLTYLEKGVAIPEKKHPNDQTIAEWIRHCKRSGLFENGKLLYEKGGLSLDNLPEETMVNVEEDYQVCIRMLLRGTS